MKKFFEYLDLPVIPENYISELLNTYKLSSQKFLLRELSYFKVYSIDSNSFKEYLKPMFPKDTLYLGLQIIKGTTEIHKDFGRMICFNYIIETGGSNVITRHYDKEKKCISEVKLEAKKWHTLSSGIWHSVENIETTRIILSLTRTSECFVNIDMLGKI